jgi:hypothetical protein
MTEPTTTGQPERTGLHPWTAPELSRLGTADTQANIAINSDGFIDS